MQINTNGKRNITLDFDAPKKFKLKKDGAEIPYLRTGKNSFRLGRNIDGVLDLEEIIEQPRIVKPMQLKAQQMALVNPNDVLMINQAAQQLEVEQNILSETQKRVEQTQAYLDIQQQRINESVLNVQGLENDNSQRITATENGIFNLAGNLATVEQNLVDGIGVVNNELQEHKTAKNPHGITKETIGLNKVDNTSDLDKPISKAVQSALDEKADKNEIQAIRDELGEYQEKNDRFTNALSNYTGGLAGNQLPDGGLEGQILAKRSDMSGDAEWIDNSASIDVDDELSLTSKNPVQNKVITSNINSLQTSKQDAISDLATIRSGAALGATAVQPSDLPTNHVTTDTTQDITGLKTIKNQLKIQSGSADGALFIGADANATTLSEGTRKIARVNMPTVEDITLPMTIISGDTIGDGGSTIGQTGNIYNRIEFGGRTRATGNTSPDGLAFCVAKVHNTKLPANKVYALEMSATQARFNVQPNYNGTNLALSTDIPTVNNPTITFTQGGTTKGTITLNQSSDQTIAFDAGGSSDVEAFTAAEVQAIWEAN